MKKPGLRIFIRSVISFALCLNAAGGGHAEASQTDRTKSSKYSECASSTELNINAESSSLFEVVSSEPFASLSEKFLERSFSKNGYSWNGADAAYSIPIGNAKTLWLFGDTFLRASGNGKKGTTKRSLSMLHNSAGVQQINDGNAPFTFSWQQKSKDNDDLLQSNRSGTWLWPLDGTISGGKLYEFVNVIQRVPSADPAFAFESLEQQLMCVSNPDDNPAQWKSKYIAIKAPGMQVGNAVTVDDTYLYTFCSDYSARSGTNHHPQIVARIPLKDIDDTYGQGLSANAMEFWCDRPADSKSQPEVNFGSKSSDEHNDEGPVLTDEKTAAGIWAHTNLAKPMVLFPDGAPEYTVTHVDGLDGYFCIYFPGAFSTEIAMRHAAHPEGPWSKPQCIYRCPVDTQKYFVYSAKNHPELCSKKGQLCLTYCVNLKSTSEALSGKNLSTGDMSEPESFYYPHAVLIQLKKSN